MSQTESVRDQRCMTPLIWAAYHNHLDIAKSLIGSNCNLDCVGRMYLNQEFYHATAFHCALLLEHFDITDLLLRASYDLHFEAYLITNEDVPIVLVKNFEYWGHLRDIATNARSLSEICRKVIRKQIGLGLQTKVQFLPLPSRIKQYILLSDVLVT